MSDFTITNCSNTQFPSELPGLSSLLLEVLEGNFVMYFVLPVSLDEIKRWWIDFLEVGLQDGNKVLFLAHEGEGTDRKLIGAVYLDRCKQPNARHRADVCKLMVARSGRRRGVGRALMEALGYHAKYEMGLKLLQLRTHAGSDAEHFYEALGWIKDGFVPDAALAPDGKTLASYSLFYKKL